MFWAYGISLSLLCVGVLLWKTRSRSKHLSKQIISEIALEYCLAKALNLNFNLLCSKFSDRWGIPDIPFQPFDGFLLEFQRRRGVILQLHELELLHLSSLAFNVLVARDLVEEEIKDPLGNIPERVRLQQWVSEQILFFTRLSQSLANDKTFQAEWLKKNEAFFHLKGDSR